MEVRTSLCRSCNAFCPVDVTIDRGRVVKVEGNRRAPLYHGYTCPKGRALPDLHNHPDRLLTSLKRQPDGSYRPIASDDLIDELADRIGVLLDRHGPRSIAAYLSGAVLDQPAAATMMISFLGAIGSPMMFTAATIDQPGQAIAQALHGRWMGGRNRPEGRDLFVVIGGNPINSKQYLPQNPGRQLKDLRRRGGKLIVIDPRRSETARLADIHLQLVPGEDPVVLAGMIHLLFAGDGIERQFVSTNVTGLRALEEAVRPFTPAVVSARAGIAEADLRAVVCMLCEAERGDVVLGTGPSMATRGTLSNYLALCLNSLRGFWARAGDEAMNPSVLLPRREFRAQPAPSKPAWGFGHDMRVRGFRDTAAGLPLAALPDEILTPGEGRVRALFMHGAAMQSWPQHAKTRRALDALDLMIMHDIVLSPTARMADFVIATRTQFEVPAWTFLNEQAASGGHSGYGYSEPFAFSQPALVDPPAGSDLLEAWQVYYRVAQRLGIQLDVANWKIAAGEARSFDMGREPATRDVYALACAGSAVPLANVERFPDGRIFDEAREFVRERDPACRDFLDLANEAMLAELRQIADEAAPDGDGRNSSFRFLLIPSRLQNSTNGAFRIEGVQRWGYNPAFLNPRDLEALKLTAGDAVRIRSRHGEIVAFVAADEGLRQGVIAMANGYGGARDGPYDPRRDGTNVNMLTHWEDDCDPHTGMPRMGALPVAIAPLEDRDFPLPQA